MTDNGVANIQLSPLIPPSMYGGLKLHVKNIDLFYTDELWACFETVHSSKAFKSWLQANQEGYLSQWRASEELAGQWGSVFCLCFYNWSESV